MCILNPTQLPAPGKKVVGGNAAESRLELLIVVPFVNWTADDSWSSERPWLPERRRETTILARRIGDSGQTPLLRECRAARRHGAQQVHCLGG